MKSLTRTTTCLLTLSAVVAACLALPVSAAPMTFSGLAESSAGGTGGPSAAVTGLFDPPPDDWISGSSTIGDVNDFANARFFGNTGGQFAVRAEGAGTWTADAEFHQSTTYTNTTGGDVAVTFSADILAGGLAVAANQDSMASYSMSISAGGTSLQTSSATLQNTGGSLSF